MQLLASKPCILLHTTQLVIPSDNASGREEKEVIILNVHVPVLNKFKSIAKSSKIAYPTLEMVFEN
jgi:hypothetical protein